MSQSANRRTALKLATVVVAMFGFGYALVPLYNALCNITGLGGRTGVASASTLAEEVDETRLVKVSFLGHVNASLPWGFEPVTKTMEVHPGKVYEVHYFASNDSGRDTTGQAVPTVVPSVASLYFSKTECFCFTQQHFAAGESREMPVRFIVSRELPADIKSVTLSYTFFDVGQS